MSWFAVVRQAGPTWLDGGVAAQPGVGEHAAFMSACADDGFVVFAGPLAGSDQGHLRALLIVDAENVAEIEERLADDPWADRLSFVSVEPWNLFVGAERIAASAPPE